MTTIEIDKATVILMQSGGDRVTLHTKLPSPCPAVDKDPLDLSFFAARDTGIEYIRKVFNLAPSVINARTAKGLPYSNRPNQETTITRRRKR